VFTNKEREATNTFVRAVFLYVAKTPNVSIKDQESLLPIIHFGSVACAFVGQPFTKQLYLTNNEA